MNPLFIGPILEIGKSLINRFFPDPEKKAAAELELLRMHQTGELAELVAATDLAKLQIQTNIEEAKSTSIFVAGWRPWIGWTCGISFAYSYVILPFLMFAVYTFGTETMVEQLNQLPKLELADMLPILFGMLGLGVMRSFDKKVGNGSEAGKH